MNKFAMINVGSAPKRSLWAGGVMLCSLFFTLNAFAIAGAPPVISVQPTNRTVSLGGSTTFTVTVTSTTALTYQWYFNGVKISGATANVYTRTNAQFTNAGPYYVAITNSGGSLNSTNALLNVTPPTNDVLAAPWVSTDIGTVGLVGSAYSVSNLYTVNGAGASLSGAVADQFHYVYQTMPGNGSITAKVVGQSGTNVNGYAGIMIRETTATGSAFMFAARQGNGTVVARSRTSTGGSTTSSNGPSLSLPNYWLELSRTNNKISAFASSNGTAWVTVQTNAFTMATNVTLGLFVTSGNTNVLDSDLFTNITAVP
jgi:regulation of enolase protein 1 (concanavalin A-like superfamily)